MKNVIIIGAGLGGLATAIRLSHCGFRVTVLEKNERVGGKMNMVQSNGYTFDTGPSLLTMPFVVRELFESVEKRMEDYLELLPVEPICRYFYPDSATFDASSDSTKTEEAIMQMSPGDAVGFRKFIAHGKRIYDASAQPFLFQPFGSLNFKGIMQNARHLPAVLKLDAFRTLNDAVETFFVDPRLRQLFNRFATYNGSSPYHAPATLAIIPYIEFEFGAWYIRGGMYKLAEALASLAMELGVTIQTNAEVAGIYNREKQASGVVLKSGQEVAAEIVVSNADALYASEELLPDTNNRFNNVEPSLSGFVLLLGVKKMFPQLKHHNIFFSSDYRAEFETMFHEYQPADDPTIYVCNTSRSDTNHAPQGCSDLFVLVNAPPLTKVGRNGHSQFAFDWEKEKSNYRNLVLRKLAAYGLHDIEKLIEYEEIITPLDFEKKYNAFRGSIYGTSSNNRMAAFLRPPNKSKDIKHLYYVGGSSHPGGGIPLVLLSGKIVSEMIQQEVGVA